MQHLPGTKFDRSTVWRRKKRAERSLTSERDKFTAACAEFDKRDACGRKPADLNENEILSFVAGVIEKLNSEGLFHPAKLSQMAQHPENGQKILVPISGCKKTIRELVKIGVPSGLLLVTTGHFLFGKRLPNRRDKERLSEGLGLQVVDSKKLELASGKRSVVKHAVEAGKRAYKFSGRGATIQHTDPNVKEYRDDFSQAAAPPDRKPTPLHRVREFRDLGVTRAMASYWRRHPDSEIALNGIAALLGPFGQKFDNLEHDFLRSPAGALYYLPLLSDRLNRDIEV